MLSPQAAPVIALLKSVTLFTVHVAPFDGRAARLV
jgi:hypothetical protein